MLKTSIHQFDKILGHPLDEEILNRTINQALWSFNQKLGHKSLDTFMTKKQIWKRLYQYLKKDSA